MPVFTVRLGKNEKWGCAYERLPAILAKDAISIE
jgi:hypothetical protein